MNEITRFNTNPPNPTLSEYLTALQDLRDLPRPNNESSPEYIEKYQAKQARYDAALEARQIAKSRPEPYAQRGHKVTLGEVLMPAFFVLGLAVFYIGVSALLEVVK